jgi:ribosome-binding protein aMBF1 (putative translation factor)
MITNARQASISRKKIERLEKELRRSIGAAKDLQPRLRRAIQESIESQLSELREDLDQFEKVRDRTQTFWRMESLEDLPTILMMARVAQGLSQAELAKKLNLKEQQIQRWEANCYLSASLKRILLVADVLGVEIQDDQVFLVPQARHAAMQLEGS